jgi:hypothetical protein
MTNDRRIAASIFVRDEMRIRVTQRTILAIGFAVFLVWAFPGYMSTDSQVQLMEARSGQFSDAHPPLMSAIWRVLDMIVAGPLLMLLLQGALFLVGLYTILERKMSPRAAAITASAIFVFPPVLTTMAVIWKDSQMAGFLMAGTACLLHPRLRVRIGGLALFVVACGVRHNGFAAVVPLVFFLFEWRSGMRWWRRTAITGAAAVLAVGAMVLVSKMLTVQTVPLTPAFQDIVGVIAFSDDKSDAELREVLRGLPLTAKPNLQARCRLLYELRGPWRITKGDDPLMDLPDTPGEWDALSRAWKELVLGEPGAYLAYHWDTYARVIGVSELPRAPVYNAFIEMPEAIDEISHNAGYSRAQEHGWHVLYWLADNTPLFRPWVYAVASLLLFILFVRDRLTAGLLVSGYLYELSFFPVGADPDYRYSHWMVATIVLATVILVAQRMRRAPS